MSAESSRTLEFNKADSLKDDKRETSHSDIQNLDACMDAAESLDEKASELAEYSASVVRQAFTQPLDKHLFQSIADITDRILADDSIGRYLIQMTSEESDLWHHSANVGLRSILAAKKILNIQDEQMLRELGIGYFLHDIGMKNTDRSEEKDLDLISEPHQELRDKHPELGVELLKGAGQLTGANEIILLQHHLAHKMADGSISNQQHAHDFAQICMLCDIFDDLTVKAPGHQGMALFEALKYIKKNMAHHFSDHILRGFIQMYVNSAEKVKQSAAVAKSAPVKNTTQPITPKVAGSASPEKPDNWKSKNKPSEQLEEVLSSSMSAEEKAEKVVQHSSDLMHEIMDQPVTNKLIEDLSAPIASLTDNILQDQELSISLMHMTSHDYYTYTHCVNVGIKSILIAKHVLGTKDDNLMRELGIGFFLHDIGKSQVDPGILNKPGKLTDAEFEIMKRHPEKGVELLQEANALNNILKITVLQHHEKIDGSGYPFGLKGDQFHEFGQICALADIYDALTAERSYKKGMTPFESLKLMKDKMRHHFDEKLFKSFIQLFVESA